MRIVMDVEVFPEWQDVELRLIYEQVVAERASYGDTISSEAVWLQPSELPCADQA